jgi:hypothetical protein
VRKDKYEAVIAKHFKMLHICRMNGESFQKPALNISWFVLILGGISLFEKGKWAILGFLVLLIGLGIMCYAIYTLYLNRTVKFTVNKVFLLASASIGILALVELFFQRYGLAVVMTLIAGFVFFVSRLADSKAKNGN